MERVAESLRRHNRKYRCIKHEAKDWSLNWIWWIYYQLGSSALNKTKNMAFIKKAWVNYLISQVNAYYFKQSIYSAAHPRMKRGEKTDIRRILFKFNQQPCKEKHSIKVTVFTSFEEKRYIGHRRKHT